MKIAFLTPEFPHAKTTPSGGIGASIMSLSKGLIKLKHSVSVIVYGQDKDDVIEENDLVIHKVKNVKFKGLSLYLTQKKVQRLINQMHASGNIDIVEAPDWTGFTAFINLRCPLILKLHGSDTYFCYLDRRKVKPKNRFLEKSALKKANDIIAVSDYVGKLTNQVFDLDLKFRVIPNAIDVELFQPKQDKEHADRILYFGTLIRKKGVLEIPEIFNKIVQQQSEIELILVGKDASDIKTGASSTWNLMKAKFSEKASKQVSYLGQVPYSEIKDYINASDLCIFPSFAEALPVSWLEAMAMKKPIVASDIGWASEMIVHGKEGYLVDPKNHQAFSDAILKILNDTALQTTLGTAARSKVKNVFDIEVVAQKNVDFYKTVLENA
ncbi:glycosyltransferase family 4 protein [Seonamhaeicola sp.]|uniref:glycosyltransferase family 4 protein n=1 Tax=Seonamhaeicola sp. TaxID=1912245 RepID=UPI0026300C42|nr:glycosyltransferase family 4 protein [Seonamhaeicola sp.]